MSIDTIIQLGALGAGALVVLALWIVSGMIKSKDAASEGLMRLSMEVVTATFKTGVDTLRESQEGQRMFFQTKVDDLLRELSTEKRERKEEEGKMHKRISDLECEVAEKDEVIDSQSRRIRTLEEELASKNQRMEALEAEVVRLSGKLNGKQDKNSTPSKEKRK